MSEALKKAAADATDFARSLTAPVGDDARFVFEATILRDVHTKWKEARALYLADTEELRAQLLAAQRRGVATVDPLSTLAKRLKTRLEDYAESKVAEQSRLLDRASEAALAGDTEQASLLTIAAEQVLPPEVPSVAVGRRFFAEVSDLLSLPEEFVDRRPRVALINRRSKAGEQIPGVQTGHTAVVRVKTKRG